MTEKKEKQHYVYFVQCNDGTLYGGWTTNLENRLQAHNNGLGAKYTRGRTPVTLVYSEAFKTKQDAMKREWQIKRLPREKKLRLIKEQAKEKSILL